MCNRRPATPLMPLILLAPRFGKLARLATLAGLAPSVDGCCGKGVAVAKRPRNARPATAARAPVAAGRPTVARRPTEGLAEVRPLHLSKRLVMTLRLGLQPHGWTVAACCALSGPVWLPPGFAASWYVPTCPWCVVNTRGLDIQRPSITCEGCRFFRRHPTDLDGRGSCAMDQGEYRPGSYHQCAWWRP